MRFTVTTIFCLAITIAGVLYTTLALCAEPPAGKKKSISTKASFVATSKKTKTKTASKKRLVTVEAARERAKLTHSIYATTLEAMHHHYFFHDRANVPARVMEDMFADIARQENIKAKWIAVNAKAMSIDHEPEGEFEKQAVKEISAGKPTYERVEKGVYRRAFAVSLMNNGCLGCHLGFGANDNKKPRFAGLVISIPVKQD